MMATPALAVQSHGGAEGLVSHQIGHTLFTAGMGYLLYRTKSTSLKGPGWFEFRLFLWLLIAWNLMTFSGHWMNEFVSSDKFVYTNKHVVAFKVDTLFDAIFYLTRLDHLVLVPSFVLLLLALRKWRMQQ
jgi:hypothetical protein